MVLAERPASVKVVTGAEAVWFSEAMTTVEPVGKVLLDLIGVGEFEGAQDQARGLALVDHGEMITTCERLIRDNREYCGFLEMAEPLLAEIPQGLKPFVLRPFAARLKSCPFKALPGRKFFRRPCGRIRTQNANLRRALRRIVPP